MFVSIITAAVSYALGLASGWILRGEFATPKAVVQAVEKAAVEEVTEAAADVEKKL